MRSISSGISLPVRMGGHVHRHPGDPGGEVGAVVEVIASQEELVRLAVAGVLGDDQSWNGFEHLSGAFQWPAADAASGNRTLAGGVEHADGIVVFFDHVDRRQGLRGFGMDRHAGCR
jgi:hypothetical protein